jgi:hypothetical protein
MPRDSSGNYTLPAGNPVVTGTLIAATWANATMPDLGNEVTLSLDRQGRGGMLAALRLFDGTSGAPGLAFSSEVASGLWRQGAGELRMGIAAVFKQSWTGTGSAFTVPVTLPGDPTADLQAATKGYVDDKVIAAQALSDEWTWSDTLTMADPGAGFMRGNNATLAACTQFAISKTSATAAPYSFGNILPGDTIYVSTTAGGPFGRYDVATIDTSAPTFALVGVTLRTASGNPADLSLTQVTLVPQSTGTGEPPASETVAGIAQLATAVEARALTDDATIVTPLKVAALAAIQTLVAATPIAWNMALGLNAQITLDSPRTLGAPTNVIPGTSGAFFITQDGVGGRTLAYDPVWKFEGGTDPTLSVAPGAVDVLVWTARAGNFLVASLLKGLA